MYPRGVDPQILLAWLSARSLARRLPPPVPEHGGFRVDTNSADEIARWVFPKIGPGLKRLARSITEPRYLLKLCGAPHELQAALPAAWQLHAPAYFMRARGEPTVPHLAEGYRIESTLGGQVSEARIFCQTGVLAASGYAAETDQVFVYDRIITQPDHRRNGLGSALMAALHAAKRHRDNPELLVATQDGRSLYSALGWETISPYSTASVVNP